MKAYLATGSKYGDICSVLPMLRCEFEKTGQKPVLIVAKKYADLLDTCDYVTPEIWQGDWGDLKGSMADAKKRYREVVMISSFGKDFPICNAMPSFQLDQWHRAEKVGEFLNHRLKFDKVVPQNKSGILICTSSESSPFPHAKDLIDMVTSNYPDKKINVMVRNEQSFTSKLEQIESAEAFICIDTGMLHLSAASTTPVLAFVTDKPTRWHGSAYHPRFAFYCRYSDYKFRKMEFAKALSMAVHNIQPPKVVDVSANLYDRPYNPSIIEHEGKTLMAYRVQQGNGKSSLAITQLINGKTRHNLPISVPDTHKEFAIEDPHLFRFNGKLHVSYTLAKFPMPPFKCVTEYAELAQIDGSWTIKNPMRVKHGINDMTQMEKNWCFFEQAGKLYAIYNQTTIIEINGDKVTKTHSVKDIPWIYGEKKGGCVVPFNGADGGRLLLRIFHSRTDHSEKPVYWMYRIGACLMKAKPPFDVISVTPQPIIAGDEEYKVASYWKPNVVFPGGAIVRSSSNCKITLDLAFGHNDCGCRIATLNETHLI